MNEKGRHITRRCPFSIGLAGCSGTVESQVPTANLEDYADMPAAEIWVVLEAVTPL